MGLLGREPRANVPHAGHASHTSHWSTHAPRRAVCVLVDDAVDLVLSLVVTEGCRGDIPSAPDAKQGSGKAGTGIRTRIVVPDVLQVIPARVVGLADWRPGRESQCQKSAHSHLRRVGRAKQSVGERRTRSRVVCPERKRKSASLHRRSRSANETHRKTSQYYGPRSRRKRA